MLGVFWNPQDKQISKLFLDLNLMQHLRDIYRFITAAVLQVLLATTVHTRRQQQTFICTGAQCKRTWMI